MKLAQMKWNLLLIFMFISYSTFLGAMDLKEAYGENYDLILVANVRQEYHDNIFYDDTNQKDELITTIIPEIQFKRNTERFNAAATVQVRGVLYKQYHELNELDQAATGRIEYRISDRLSVAAGLQYDRDSRRDRDIETTGLVLTNNIRIRQAYDVSARYVVSEKNSLSTSYAYTKEDFEDDYDADMRSHQISLGFYRWVTPRTTLQTFLTHTTYDYPNIDTQNTSLTIGANHILSETLSGEYAVGLRYTQSEFLQNVLPFPFLLLQQVEEDSYGFVGQMALNYTGEVSNGRLSVYHDIKPASGQGGTTNRTGLTADFSRRFTEKMSCGVNTSYFINQADQNEHSTREEDEWTFSIRPSIRYRLNEDLSLVGAYTYRRNEDEENNESIESNVIWLQMVYKHDFMPNRY